MSVLILFVAAKSLLGSAGKLEDASLELDVEVIHCQSCENRIEKAIGTMDGVTGVSADATTIKVQIAGEVSREEILKVLGRIGFSEL